MISDIMLFLNSSILVYWNQDATWEVEDYKSSCPDKLIWLSLSGFNNNSQASQVNRPLAKVHSLVGNVSKIISYINTKTASEIIRALS